MACSKQTIEKLTELLFISKTRFTNMWPKFTYGSNKQLQGRSISKKMSLPHK